MTLSPTYQFIANGSPTLNQLTQLIKEIRSHITQHPSLPSFEYNGYTIEFCDWEDVTNTIEIEVSPKDKAIGRVWDEENDHPFPLSHYRYISIGQPTLDDMDSFLELMKKETLSSVEKKELSWNEYYISIHHTTRDFRETVNFVHMDSLRKIQNMFLKKDDKEKSK